MPLGLSPDCHVTTSHKLPHPWSLVFLEPKAWSTTGLGSELVAADLSLGSCRQAHSWWDWGGVLEILLQGDKGRWLGGVSKVEEEGGR